MKPKSKNKKNLIKGQLMIITVLILGGVVISAASLLGFLIVYKLRQATDIAESAKAVFASDAGREWEFWQVKLGHRLGASGCPQFTNGAGFETIVGVSDDGKILYGVSTGKASKNARVFQFWYPTADGQPPLIGYPVYPTDQISASCF